MMTTKFVKNAVDRMIPTEINGKPIILTMVINGWPTSKLRLFKPDCKMA